MQPQPTPLVVEVFRVAADMVRQRGHLEVRVEHILLALLALDEGGAVAALDTVGTDREVVRVHLEAALPPSGPSAGDGELPYDPGAVDLLGRLFFRTQEGEAEMITTADLLLAILDRRAAPAPDALARASVDLSALAEALRARRSDG